MNTVVNRMCQQCHYIYCHFRFKWCCCWKSNALVDPAEQEFVMFANTIIFVFLHSGCVSDSPQEELWGRNRGKGEMCYSRYTLLPEGQVRWTRWTDMTNICPLSQTVQASMCVVVSRFELHLKCLTPSLVSCMISDNKLSCDETMPLNIQFHFNVHDK